MKSIASLLIYLSLSLACFAAEEAEIQLPKVTEPIISELNAARAKSATEAIKKLQKVQGDLTKKGDLDGAMATKKYIDGLQKSLGDGNKNLLGTAADPIIGKWGDGNEVRWELKADGVGVMNNGRMFKWEKDSAQSNVYNLSQLPGPDRTITIKTSKLSVEFVPSTKETHDLWLMK